MSEFVEKSDSSAAQTRALAAALSGKHFDIYDLGFAARSIGRFFPLAPDAFLDAASRAALGRIGIPQSASLKIRTRDLAAWTTSKFPKRSFDSILLGAPSGGISHIGSIANAPFLTSHFLFCFRDMRHVDDIERTLSKAKTLADNMARLNPDLFMTAHCDPVHDRPVLVFINHVRAKMISLHRGYKKFIETRLAPGGALFVINCTYPWKQYRIGPRASFQIGGLGGVPDTEFLDGSPRIKEYLDEKDIAWKERGDTGWKLRSDKYPLESMPESEWGARPEFNESVIQYAKKEGIRAITLTADHPDKFSELAFELHLEASRRDGVEPLHLFADCFNQLDPIANLEARMLPLWLPYYCDNSFKFARRILDRAPAGIRTLLTLHPSFADPFDMVPIEKWIDLFTLDTPPLLIGVQKHRFPEDLSYVWDFGRQIKQYSRKHKDPVHTRLKADEIAETAERIGMKVE